MKHFDRFQKTQLANHFQGLLDNNLNIDRLKDSMDVSRSRSFAKFLAKNLIFPLSV